MDGKRARGWIKHLDFMIVDLLCIELAYVAAYWMRRPDYYLFRGISLYTYMNIILLVIDIVYVLIWPVYRDIIKRGMYREVLSVLFHNLVIWLFTIAYLYLTQQSYQFSRTMMAYAIVLCILFMVVARLSWKTVIRRIMQKGKYQANILVLSSADYSAKMIRRFRERMYNGFNLKGLGILDQDLVGEKIEKVPVVCNRKSVIDYVKEEAIDEVMICFPGNTQGNRQMVHLLLEMGIVVHLAVDYVEDDFPNTTIEEIGGFTFLTTSVQNVRVAGMRIKRLIDILAGLVGCAITGVLFLFLAPLIKSASPGPVFYRQVRVGRNGRRFTMYKFRSMEPDADEHKEELMSENKMEGQMFKIDNDPRIISKEKGIGKNIGERIRRSSLDEFPQFINILRGDMSLVGTRPPTEDEYEKYHLHHMIRLSMKPGLTGLWQVSGRSEITDFEKVVELDTEYIENWNLRLDFKIICKTFKVVIQRRGAA